MMQAIASEVYVISRVYSAILPGEPSTPLDLQLCNILSQTIRGCITVIRCELPGDHCSKPDQATKTTTVRWCRYVSNGRRRVSNPLEASERMYGEAVHARSTVSGYFYQTFWSRLHSSVGILVDKVLFLLL